MGTGWRRAFCTSIRGDPDHSIAYTTTLPSPSSSSSSSSLHKKLRNSHQQQHEDVAEEQTSPSPPLPIVSISKLSSIGTLFGSSSSNPSTPRSSKKKHQNHSTSNSARSSPSIDRHTSSSPPPPPPLSLESSLQCNTNAGVNDSNNPDEIIDSSTKKKKPSKLKDLSPRLSQPKHSSSPSLKSPSRFALFKTALRLSRNPCGICGESVSQKTAAIFTAECSHSFHFPCISSHVNTITKNQTTRQGRTRLLCPVCSADWHQVPLLSSSSTHDSQLPVPTKSLHKTNNSSGNKPESINRGSRRQSSKVATSKIYDDDESLQLSPTSQSPNGGMSQFNPIPEELEVEEEEEDAIAEENSSFINLIPDSVALVSTGLTHLNYVVSIKLKAPKLPPKPQSTAMPSSLLDHPSCRAPIDLVTVLDVSGNMTTEKLQMLKRATRSVISSMGPGDRLSIVAFSVVAAKRLLPLRRMTRQGQRSARQIIDRLVVCGKNQAVHTNKVLERLPSSCMGDALKKATKVLEDRRERNPVATIMLLSDGQSQEQSPHEENIPDNASNQNMKRATRFTHVEIPIHQQKREKEGSNVFADSVNIVLQDMKLHFTLPSVINSGAEISSVYSFSSTNSCDIGQAMTDGGRGKFVCLGDLYAEEEKELLVEIRVPKTAVVEGSVISTLSVACSYRNPLSRDVISREEKLVNLPNTLPLYQSSGKLLRSNSSSSSSSRPTTPTSFSVAEAALASQLQLQQQQQLRNLFITIRALAESRRLVELGDMDTALHLLTSARTLLFQQSSTSLSSANKCLLPTLEAEVEVLQKQQKQRKMQYRQPRSMSPSLRNRSNGEHASLLADVRGGGGEREPLTPTSAWRSAEQLAKVAIMRKSLNRVSDLHGFENARF